MMHQCQFAAVDYDLVKNVTVMTKSYEELLVMMVMVASRKAMRVSSFDLAFEGHQPKSEEEEDYLSTGKSYFHGVCDLQGLVSALFGYFHSVCDLQGLVSALFGLVRPMFLATD